MHSEQLLSQARVHLATARWTDRCGIVSRVMPTFFEAHGPCVARGSLCSVGEGPSQALAEVIQVDDARLVLAPLSATPGLAPGMEIRVLTDGDASPVGHAFAGRMVDGLGRALDGGTPVAASGQRPLHGTPLAPLLRSGLIEVLETGVRAVDCLLPLAIGQRIGIFAGSGVGKSTLIADLAQAVAAEALVVCLVGERGREAEHLWHRLSADRRAHTTMVVATSDQPAALRVRAAYFAMTLAESLRANGQHVLLLLDSVTRLAMALREVGLAAGEPPTLRAYTPSVFAALPRFVERCGALREGGAISAIMTVLTENDDAEDPLAETMKSILDGHIVLSRELAEQGHFPAIDVARSVSRLAHQLRNGSESALASEAIAGLSHYAQARVLIESGLYQPGSQAALDRSLAHRPALLQFLQQASGTFVDRRSAFETLAKALGRSS